MNNNEIINPIWDEGIILKKSDGGNLVLIIEFAGVLLIPLLGLFIVVMEPSVASSILFLFTILISYEIVMSLGKKNFRVCKEGLEVNEKLKVLPGGAICIILNEPTFINWDDIDRIKVYQPKRDVMKPSIRDTLSNMSMILCILDNDFDSFFHLVTKDGNIYRGRLKNKKSVINFKNALRSVNFNRVIINH